MMTGLDFPAEPRFPAFMVTASAIHIFVVTQSQSADKTIQLDRFSFDLVLLCLCDNRIGKSIECNESASACVGHLVIMLNLCQT